MNGSGMIAADLGFDLIDADNHYYEAEDAFLRHGDEDVKRFVRWIQEGKRRKLVFGDRISDTPGNPTFNPIAKAGAFHQRLKDLEAGQGPQHRLGVRQVPVRRAGATARRLPGSRRAPRRDGRAGRRAVLPLPDPR